MLQDSAQTVKSHALKQTAFPLASSLPLKKREMKLRNIEKN